MNKIALRSTLWTGATAYFSQASSIIVALLTVRLASQYLPQQEFGLWAFTYSSVGYFFLLEMGVGGSLSRLLGEPLAVGNQAETNGWFTLAFLITSLQAIVIFAFGMLARDFIISFSQIPESLRGDMRYLWLWVLVSRCAAQPFSMLSAVLYAQNRVYLQNIVLTIAGIANFLFFWWMLSHGKGVFSYGYSLAVFNIIVIGGWIFAVISGPHRIWFSIDHIPWPQVKYVFGYSMGVFGISMAGQITALSQTMILTKILGLDAAAAYNVTSRIPGMFPSLLMRPFDAFVPRWQLAVCSGDDRLARSEFPTLFRFSMLLTFAAFIFVAVANPEFICWWTKPAYYGGLLLNILLAAVLPYQCFRACYGSVFNIFKRIRGFSIVSVLCAALEIACSIVFVKRFGIVGIPLGVLVAGILSLVWFCAIYGSKLICVNPIREFLRDAVWCFPLAGAALLIAFARDPAITHVDYLRFISYSVIATCLGAPLVFRAGKLLWKIRNAS